MSNNIEDIIREFRKMKPIPCGAVCSPATAKKIEDMCNSDFMQESMLTSLVFYVDPEMTDDQVDIYTNAAALRQRVEGINNAYTETNEAGNKEAIH